MLADESEAVLQSPPSQRKDASWTGAVNLATPAVSSVLKIDLPPFFKGDGTESFTLVSTL
jgi:hypothetical protein